MHRAWRIAVIGAIGLAWRGGGRAAETESETTWTITPSVVSQYMFRGLRLGGPALQPSVEADHGGLSAGIWSSVPLANRLPGQSDPEIDGYASYRFSLSPAVGIQPGCTWYTYPRADPGRGFYRSTFEPSLAVNFTFRGFVVSPKAYYDVVLDGATYELNAAYALPLRAIGSELDFTANAGTYERRSAVARQAPGVKSWGDYWLLGVALPYQIARSGRVSLGIACTEGSGSFLKQGLAPKVRNAAAVRRGVVTLSYTLSF